MQPGAKNNNVYHIRVNKCVLDYQLVPFQQPGAAFTNMD